MNSLEIAEKAIKICVEHLEQNCKDCPLQEACNQNSPYNQEGLAAWVLAVNSTIGDIDHESLSAHFQKKD